jgi:hypothetical protein
MMGEIKSDLSNEQFASFGDSSKSMVLHLGKVVISLDLCVENVMLVEILSYNLLFVSQLANMAFIDVGIMTLLWSKNLIVASLGMSRTVYMWWTF